MLSEEEKKLVRLLKQILETLSRDEMVAFRYVWEHISVGEIIAEKELRVHFGVKKPDLMMKRLREKGLIERGEGCYNLASWLRPLRRKHPVLDNLLALA